VARVLARTDLFGPTRVSYLGATKSSVALAKEDASRRKWVARSLSPSSVVGDADKAGRSEA